MSNFVEGLLETIHKNTSTNDLHQINTVQCRKAIETYTQYYIKEFGLDQVEQKILWFSKNEAIDILRGTIEHMIEDNDLDGLAKMLSCMHTASLRVGSSRVYYEGSEVTD